MDGTLPAWQTPRGWDDIKFQSGLTKQLIDLANTIGRRARHGAENFVKFVSQAIEQAFRHSNHGHFMDSLLPFAGIIIEKGHDGSAGILFVDQLHRQMRTRAAGANNADSRRWIGRRAFLFPRALTPPSEQSAETTEQTE